MSDYPLRKIKMINKLFLKIFILVLCFFCVSIQKNYSSEIFQRIITKEITIDGVKYQHFYIEKTENKNIDKKIIKTINHANDLNNKEHQQTLNTIDEELIGKIVSRDYSKETNNIVFPNPVIDRISLYLNERMSEIKNISVYDINGKRMDNSLEINISNESIDAHKLPFGIYLMSITLVDGRNYNLKFIKQ
jgi:hypothetical protein